VAAPPPDQARAGRAPVAGRGRGARVAAERRGRGRGDEPRQPRPGRHRPRPPARAAAACHTPAAGADLAPGREPEPGGVARSGPAAPRPLPPRTLARRPGGGAPCPAGTGAAPGGVRAQAARTTGTCMRVTIWT